jgi:hypothetical protein
VRVQPNFSDVSKQLSLSVESLSLLTVRAHPSQARIMSEMDMVGVFCATLLYSIGIVAHCVA